MESEPPKDLYAGKDVTFRETIWNSKTNEFLGRTGLSWAKIGFFYLCFYLCLAGFFGGMMAAFYQTLDTVRFPTYIPGDGGSILRHPSLGFRPLPPPENVESTLIWYKDGDNDDIKHWTNSMDYFIRGYESIGDTKPSGEVITCDETNLPQDGQVCMFKDSWLTGKCNKNEKWGFTTGSPCVIVKMNRMIGWVPDVYTTLEEVNAVQAMPQNLKDDIRIATEQNNGIVPKRVWLNCVGENPSDDEYLGPIEYSPVQGFEGYFFPYNHDKGYQSPIVGVNFLKPKTNVLINIECFVWAKNIVHARKERLGLVHFELLLD